MPKSLDHQLRIIESLIREGNAVIRQQLDHIITTQHYLVKELSMEKDEIARLVASTTANTNATKAAADALAAFVASNADLVQKLKDAIAAQGSDVSQDIHDAVAAIDANTATLTAAVPQLAQAITDNTREQQAPGVGV